jgi:AcrR family transcriptional regulator
VSVRAIATRAGVSPTALYLHFPDRDALVEAAVDAGFAVFNRELMEAAAGLGAPQDRLVRMGLAYLGFAERHAALYAVLFSARRPTVHRAPPAGGVDRDEALAGLVTLLRAADPALDEAPARELALTIWAALHGFATLRRARTQHEWPTSEAFVRSVLRSLLTMARN